VQEIAVRRNLVVRPREGKERVAERKGLGVGDVWMWTAICADIKLVPSSFVGGRDSHTL
jgi:hypothetical protein